MSKLFSISFWVQAFINVFITLLIIYVIKSVGSKYEIPVVSKVSQAV